LAERALKMKIVLNSRLSVCPIQSIYMRAQKVKIVLNSRLRYEEEHKYT
jgi:hypothetical protein